MHRLKKEVVNKRTRKLCFIKEEKITDKKKRKIRLFAVQSEKKYTDSSAGFAAALQQS